MRIQAVSAFRCEHIVTLFRPKSILRLILIGFILVALPLMAALVYAVLRVDVLVDQSQQALFQSVRATRRSQALLEALTAMERNARQYQVIGDTGLFDGYSQNYDKFVETAASLSDLHLDNSQRQILEPLRRDVRSIHSTLNEKPHDAPDTESAVARFDDLVQSAQQILTYNRRLIDREVDNVEATAGELQRTLVSLAGALVPVTLVLTVFFAILITRPIRQIDRAIRRLGDEEFGKPSVVSGPRDLVQVGERLNWLRTRLLQLEEEKTKFLQHISHELKTPLTAVREGAELLNEQVVGNLNEQQREIATILRDNSVQLQKLIEDLLNFSVARSRTSELHRSKLKLDRVIESVLSDHKVAMMARNIRLQKSLREIAMWGDKEKLRIIVDNLVSNAVKYSPDGGEIRVGLDKRGRQALITVVDSGTGIPDEEKERVFEAFYQGRGASNSHIRGTGLGLSIAKEYVQAHGGEITVGSGIGTGARLRVCLPLNNMALRSAEVEA